MAEQIRLVDVLEPGSLYTLADASRRGTYVLATFICSRGIADFEIPTETIQALQNLLNMQIPEVTNE